MSAERDRGYDVCRYVAAGLLLLYGFAKLNGSQFTVLESELDKPMREVSGFWLTWYYFGYSRVYGLVLALVQVGGAIGLMVRRTALVAACVLFLVVGNIVLIDVFYAIDCGALLAALVIEACLLCVMLRHKERLAALVVPDERRTRWFTHVLRAALVIGAFAFTWWIANYNNIRPTPIDGVWRVERAIGANAPAVVYFEPTRAYLCVFRYADGTTRDHHFDVDERTRSIAIYEQWLTKGPLLFRGTYDGTRVHLASDALRLTLLRR